MFVNYEESILNYIASIRNYYKLDSSYHGDKRFSKFLKEHKFEQIILVLIDAMGSRLLEKHLDKDAFLNRYKLREVSTVFPTTTTAATTSILNGKSPNENCWLGWIQYDDELKDYIIPFLNTGFYSHQKFEDNHMRKKYPIKDIVTELNEKGIKARKIFPSFDPVDGVNSLEEFSETIVKESLSKKNKFVYAYWDEYDSLMHKVGPSSKEAKSLLKRIDRKLEETALKLGSKTLMVIIADHGQVDVENEYIMKTKLVEYFEKKPDIEPRALNFYIKKDKLEQFRKDFLELYEDECILLTHDEVIKTKLFGSSENHKDFESKIGDFIAISKGHKHFVLDDSAFKFKGSHAGANIDELMVPFIIYYNY